ncbi:non-receptor tyrosine-protein kinase TYK2-like isoform X3 [Paramacrobiotus metropolitanus]|nr:non-receptor tyrosine-protein kinase TYK2-like isoform X3 [Paramacrobiotus metropolitanus]
MLRNCISVLQLKHENLVQYYKLTTRHVHKGIVAEIMMEYFPDGKLDSFLRNTPKDKFSLINLVNFAHQISKGLAFLHANRIIHGDLEPENIFLHYQRNEGYNLRIGTLEYVDFCTVEGKRTPETGPVNVSYMSPEMLTHITGWGDVNRCGRKTDVWSLGCTILDLAHCHYGIQKRWMYNNKAEKKFRMDHFTIIDLCVSLMEGYLPMIPDIVYGGIKTVTQRCFCQDVDLRITASDVADALDRLAVAIRPVKCFGSSCLYHYDHKSDQIGGGASGCVYKARITERGDFTGDSVVAVKRIFLKTDTRTCDSSFHNPENAVYEQMWTSLLSLKHDNEVTYYKIDTERQQVATIVELVMDYAPDGDLDGFIKSGRSLSWANVVSFSQQTAAGVEFLHTHNFVHCDLKPANVLMRRQCGDKWNLQITDLDDGIITEYSHVCTKDIGRAKGTSRYMSPEIAKMHAECDANKPNKKTDIWSLGCIVMDLMDCHCGNHDKWFHLPSQSGDACIDTRIRMSERGNAKRVIVQIAMGFVPLMFPSVHGRIIGTVKNCFCYDSGERDSAAQLLDKLKKLDSQIGDVQKNFSASLHQTSSDSAALLRILGPVTDKDVQLAVAWVVKNRADQNRSEWGGRSIASACDLLGLPMSDGPQETDTVSRSIKVHPDIISWLDRIYERPDPTDGAVHCSTARNELPRPICRTGNYWFQKDL